MPFLTCLSDCAMPYLSFRKNIPASPPIRPFSYHDPSAVKGGHISLLAAHPSFSTFNPYLTHHIAAAGAERLYATLMVTPIDYSSFSYPYAAKSFEETPTSLTFSLRDHMSFSNGASITCADLVYSFSSLKTFGPPAFQFFYKNVTAKCLSSHQIKFTTSAALLRSEEKFFLGKLPIFFKPKQGKDDFATPHLTPPPASGPYQVRNFVPNNFIVYQRRADWWGENIPSMKGKYNFETITYHYYSHNEAAFEAFKKGLYDWRSENQALAWHKKYDFPAVQTGKIQKIEAPLPYNLGLNGIFFNMRRPLFKDRRVRQALSTLFDFETINTTMLFDAYERNNTVYFSPHFSRALTLESSETQCLQKFKHLLPEDFEAWVKESTAPSLTRRERLIKAEKLLSDAGWHVKEGTRYHHSTQTPLTFKILLTSAGTARLLLPYIEEVKRLGIKAQVHVVDEAHFMQALRTHNFDMIVRTLDPLIIPGAEQQHYWGSQKANQEGTFNISGVQDPLIDRLIEQISQAQTQKELAAATKALDWIIHYHQLFIPMWHRTKTYIAYWDKFKMPTHPLSANLIDTWSIKTPISES